MCICHMPYVHMSYVICAYVQLSSPLFSPSLLFPLPFLFLCLPLPPCSLCLSLPPCSPLPSPLLCLSLLFLTLLFLPFPPLSAFPSLSATSLPLWPLLFSAFSDPSLPFWPMWWRLYKSRGASCFCSYR